MDKLKHWALRLAPRWLRKRLYLRRRQQLVESLRPDATAEEVQDFEDEKRRLYRRYFLD